MIIRPDKHGPGRNVIVPARGRLGRRTVYLLVVIFLVLTAGIILGGFFYYRSFERSYRAEVERQLSAIVDLKVDELTQWRKERLADAHIFFKNSAFSALMKRVLETPGDTDARSQMTNWLSGYEAYGQYDRFFLLDTQGAVRMTVPATDEPTAPHLQKDVLETLRGGLSRFLDFHTDRPGEPIHLTVLVPVMDPDTASQPLGVLAFRIDPKTYLYPFINRWPTSSETAETLLVRRDGNDVLFLNELRFDKDAALNLRIPLDKTDTPAVAAVLGREGIMEGVDYRGAPVVAVTRSIPDSPWFLVARMDSAEIYRPLQQRLRQIIVLVTALLFGLIASLSLVWRQQRTHFYQERYEAAAALHDSEQRLHAMTDSAQDAILMMDPQGLLSYWNPAAERILGYSSAEALGKDLHGLLAPKRYLEAHHAAFPEFLRTGRGAAVGKTLELHAVRKDGRQIDVALSLSAVQIEGAWHAVGIMRDITDQKRAEEERGKTLRQQQGISPRQMESTPIPMQPRHLTVLMSSLYRVL